MMEGSVQCDVGKQGKGFCSKLISYGTVATLTLLLCTVVFIERRNDVSMQWNLSSIKKDLSNATALNSDSISSHHMENFGGATNGTCKAQLDQRWQQGTGMLPKGIIQHTSDLEPRPLWTVVDTKEVTKTQKSLLTIAVGIKQKKNVDEIIKKFPEEYFTVMLFHYDGNMDGWNEFSWSSRAIHVSAMNQTKWWFSKRFLHPDIVEAYNYIFVWDEDIGVDNFNACRYVEIVKREGLDVSQPALDPILSEIHHPITMRRAKNKVHRRTYKFRGSGLCFDNSTQPPCTGWVEMMVPVFSRAAWRCAWHMIQNDLVHSWGMDYKLGYCAQGDRSKRVGVVDSEYIVHYGIPSLGGDSSDQKKKDGAKGGEGDRLDTQISIPVEAAHHSHRADIRKQSYLELIMFRRRWMQAVEKDKCWMDPY